MAARRRRKAAAKGPDRPGPLAVGLALVSLRLFTGAFWLASAFYKLFEPGFGVFEKIAWFRDADYVPMIENAVAHPPRVLGVELGLYADFLEGVMLPLAGVAAPAILLFEVLLGLGLVLGLGVRLLAGLGFVMTVAFSLAKPQPGQEATESVGVLLLTVHSANWPVAFLLLALSLLAAGRVLGLDALLRRRGPPWLRWIG